MRLLPLLHASFSRYELAVLGYLLHWVLTLVVVAAVIKGQGWFAAALAVLVLLNGILTFVASLCPECGKSPMYLRLGLRSRGLNNVFAIGRLWPERICSDCGTRLDED